MEEFPITITFLETILISHDLKQKKEAGFGQLPLLVINDKKRVWQSGSIMRYVAALTKTAPENLEDEGIQTPFLSLAKNCSNPLTQLLILEWERIMKFLRNQY